MAAAPQRPTLITIVGPTASGKSDLAIKIAKKFDGEIIATDSRTIYKGLDIGTAKPTEDERLEIPHWGLDLIEPGEVYSAAQFKEYALEKIREIRARGRLPIIVGGTGLYIDSVLFNFEFRAKADKRLRQELENKDVEQLKEIIRSHGYLMPKNHQNKRHLVRTIESQGIISRRDLKPMPGSLIIGLMPPDDILRERINSRAERMFDAGVVDETKKLIQKYGETSTRSAGIIYRVCADMICGSINEQKAIETFRIRDWQYARRQRTWFKRNPFITWFTDSSKAFRAVTEVMNT